MAKDFPPREKHGIEPLLRLSGLEPLTYQPDASNMRSTFLKIGERCNVAGSSIYKKAIVDGDFDKALGIAAKQVSAPWIHSRGTHACMHACVASSRHVQLQGLAFASLSEP